MGSSYQNMVCVTEQQSDNGGTKLNERRQVHSKECGFERNGLKIYLVQETSNVNRTHTSSFANFPKNQGGIHAKMTITNLLQAVLMDLQKVQ